MGTPKDNPNGGNPFPVPKRDAVRQTLSLHPPVAPLNSRHSQCRFRIDDCQKVFDLPHRFYGVTAASPDAQRLVLEICMRLSLLPKSRLVLPAVEHIIREAQRQSKSLTPLHLDMHVILAGFIDRYE